MDLSLPNMTTNSRNSKIKTMSQQEIEKFLGGRVAGEKRNWFVQVVKAESLPPETEVTAVAIVACLNNKILFIRNKRGWDIPGGHIEKSDATLEEAVKRELAEETCVQCHKVELTGYMVSDYYPDRPTYIAIFRTELSSVPKFEPRHETLECQLVSPKEAVNLYYGNPTLIKTVINTAFV